MKHYSSVDICCLGNSVLIEYLISKILASHNFQRVISFLQLVSRFILQIFIPGIYFITHLSGSWSLNKAEFSDRSR